MSALNAYSAGSGGKGDTFHGRESTLRFDSKIRGKEQGALGEKMKKTLEDRS
jgi:hypothetical protein